MRTLKLCLLFAACLAASSNLSAADVFTYLSGPNFCSTAPGYPDMPYCTIPGEIPLGSFPMPGPGGNYIDPNFGGMVRILTAAPYTHVYSQPSPVSAHNRYLGIRGKDSGRASILNFTTGHFDYDPLPISDSWVWDAYNDDIHYRIEGTRILKTVLSSGQETVLVDYSQTSQHFTALTSGGSTDTSKDNWLGFYAPDQHQICTVDLNTVRTYCADYMLPEATSRVGWESFDYVMVSKGTDSTSGKRYVLLMGAPAMGMWSVNLITGKLDFETRGPDNYEWGSNRDTYCDLDEVCLSAPHADVMEDSDGKQYLVTAKGVDESCSLQMVTMDLSKGRYMSWPVSAGGGLKTVFNLSNCGETWPDFDLGCAKNAPSCVLSTYRNSWRNPADLTSPISAEPHRDQIAIMRGNGQELKFLATTRTVTFLDDSYWPQPRAALSPDGQYVVFDSNFGVDGGERVAILSTFAPTGAVKAVSVAPAAVSGSTQTLTLTYFDIAGASDLSTASLWIKAAAGSPSANSCMIVYDRAGGAIKLADDSGNGWLSIVPGAAGTIQNSQCSLNGAGVTVVLSSNNLVLSVPLTMKPAYSGAKQVWISASGNAGSSGWQQLGSWTVPTPVVSNTSVTPAAGTGAAQTFTAVFNDTAGAADLASASLSITSNSASNAASCYITWTRATGQFNLLDDAGAPSLSAQNSQCSLNVASARAADSGTVLTLTLPLTFKPAFGGAKGVWMMAGGSASGSSRQQLGSWTVPGPAVTNTSITPANGTGAVQTFTAVWTNTAGSTNLTTASLWITANASGNSAGSCYITWTRAANQFRLLDDSGTPSSAAQNSQCSLNVASARATDSGNLLTLSLAVTFTPAFAGAKGLWMTASGTPNGSALQQLGTWTAPAVVTNTSVSAKAGAGGSATFTAVWTDTGGAADVVSLAFRINSTGGTAPSGCNIAWNATTRQVQLLDDAGVASSASQNSQCSLGSTPASVVAAGNTMTLTLPVIFKPAFAGVKGLWMSAVGNLGRAQSQKLGAWTVSVPVVSAVSAAPASGQGGAQTFTLSYSDSVGASDLVSVWFWFTSNFNAAAGNTCRGYYERASNQIKLLDDAGSLWTSALRGSTGVLENSQCSIDMGSAAVASNGNTLTLSLGVTFKTAFAGTKDLWMYGSGLSGNSEWVKLATWTIPAAPVVQPPPPVDAVSVAPSTGAGSAQTFTLVFSDTAGVSDLTSAWFWFTPSFNGSAVNTCFGYYDRIAGQFKLLSDAGSLWSTTMQNSQCAFDGTIRAIADGNTLTLVLPIRFGSSFNGLKEIWTFASGRSASSDWKKLATWTVQ